MKRFAEAGEPPVVIPVIGVAVNVHVALVVPAVEGDLNVMKRHQYHHLLNTLKVV